MPRIFSHQQACPPDSCSSIFIRTAAAAPELLLLRLRLAILQPVSMSHFYPGHLMATTRTDKGLHTGR